MAEPGEDAGAIQTNVVDPTTIGDRPQLAAALSILRARTGMTIRALARAVDQPAATIGGYFSGQHLPGVSQTELFRRILRHLGVHDGPELEQWVDALARVRTKPGPRPSDLPAPYRGLESFRTEDERWFFGREELCDSVIRRICDLAKDPGAGAILALVGASGSGKSSLLKAGVVPAIAGGKVTGGLWRSVYLCPGEQPIRRLSSGLAAALGGDEEAIEARLLTPSSLPTVPREIAGVVVIVDQFEELFTICEEAERRAFIGLLAEIPGPKTTQGDAPIVFVLGLRADFYGRVAREASLVPVLQHNQLIVGPMTVDELRRAITEPARMANLGIEDDLVDLLIDEVAPLGPSQRAQNPGSLPLLSHALLETWGRARRGQLTVSDYRAAGGIAAAVQQTAERVFAELTPDEQGLARRIFLRMVNVDDEVVTRRRVLWAELPGCRCDVLSPAECPLEAVVDRFVLHRLLTVQATSVEVSHEALLAAWPRLHEWVDADRAGLRTHRQLSDAARSWADDNRDLSGLLRGVRLEVARGWASAPGNRDSLNIVEQSFLDTSEVEAERQEALARRHLGRLKGLLAAMAILALVASALAAIAVRSRDAADVARKTAQSRQLAIQANRLRETDPSLAMQLALIAYRSSPTPDARSALLDSSALPSATRLLGQPGATAMAVSPDERTLAVSRSTDGSVQLFTLDPEGIPSREGVLDPPAPGFELFAVAFSPDGATLATGGSENAIRLWNVADRAHPQLVGEPLRGFTHAVQSVAFSPDGRTLAAGSSAPDVLSWEVTDPAHPNPLPPFIGMIGTTQSVGFRPDGHMIATGGTDGTVRLWSWGAGDAFDPTPTELRVGPTTINAVAFSPDGRLVAAGSKDKTIRVWDVTPGGPPTEVGPALTGFGSWVNVVAFSDDGRTLGAGSSDNTVRFWDVDGWKPREPTLATASPVTGVSFLGGQDKVVSVATDGVARIWDWPGPVITGASDTVFNLSYGADGRRLALFANHAEAVEIWDTSVPLHPRRSGRVELPPGIGTVSGTGAISPDGRFLAAGTTIFRLQLWDIGDLTAPVLLGPALDGPTQLIEQVVFSPDSRVVAAASDDGAVRLWDLSTPTRPSPLTSLTGPAGFVLGIGFSPDGKLLAAASADKSVWLWNVEDPARPVLLATISEFDNYAYSVTFSPDGAVLAAGSADKSVRLWDVTDPHHPRLLGSPLTGPGNYVYFLAFDPRGDILAAAVPDGSVWQWDVRHPERARAIANLTAAVTGQVFGVAYSPDGSQLAATDDRAVRLWSTDPDRTGQQICAMAGDSITSREWAQYLPDQPYDPPCDDSHIPGVDVGSESGEP